MLCKVHRITKGVSLVDSIICRRNACIHEQCTTGRTVWLGQYFWSPLLWGFLFQLHGRCMCTGWKWQCTHYAAQVHSICLLWRVLQMWILLLVSILGTWVANWVPGNKPGYCYHVFIPFVLKWWLSPSSWWRWEYCKMSVLTFKYFRASTSTIRVQYVTIEKMCTLGKQVFHAANCTRYLAVRLAKRRISLIWIEPWVSDCIRSWFWIPELFISSVIFGYVLISTHLQYSFMTINLCSIVFISAFCSLNIFIAF